MHASNGKIRPNVRLDQHNEALRDLPEENMSLRDVLLVLWREEKAVLWFLLLVGIAGGVLVVRALLDVWRFILA